MNPAIRQLFKRGNRTAWVTLVISLGLVLLSNYVIYLQASKAAEHNFKSAAKDVLDNIDDRLRGHELILLGGAGFLDASESVNRSSWRAYVARLQLDRHQVGGMQGVGYSQLLQPNQLAAHVMAVQADGFSEYSVRPAGLRSLYAPIVYLEPYHERARSVIGLDMLAEPIRAQVLRHAAESAHASMSGKVRLAGEPQSNPQAGFLMVAPVYRKHQPLGTAQERWQALQGFVFSAYRAKDFMAKLVGESSLPLTFRIFDGKEASAEALLYDSSVPSDLVTEGATSAQWKLSELKPIYGRHWTIQFQSKALAEANWLGLHNLIFLFMGISLSGLLFLFVSVLNSRRERAEAMAREMTGELRTQVERERQSQQLLDVMVEHLPVGVFLKRAQDLRYVMCNRTWEQVHEQSRTEILGKTVYECFSKEEADRFTAADHKTLATTEVTVVEENHIHTARGQRRILRSSKFALRNPEGEATHLLGISMDITGKMDTQQALQEGAQLTQAILDHVAEGIITVNDAGIVKAMNQAAERIYGYSAQEVVGQGLKMLMPESYFSQLDEALKIYRRTGILSIFGQRREVEGRRREGHIFPMELTITGSTHLGQPLLIGLVRDLTERKQAEQMKASFVATVSHELRTPLTSINGVLGLVSGGVLGELPTQAKSMLDMAYKNSQRLTHLINDLLDMEKMAAGMMRLDLKVEDLMPLIEQVIESTAAFAQQYQVTVALTEKVDGVRVRVDAGRLQQVLSNFLSNAVKFSATGAQVEVAVRLEKNEVRVLVMDHGPGVPVNFRGRIFQKFSQADDSNTRQKGGSGLGLAISKDLIERMNGLVGFESQLGQGASFYFVLPCWQENALASMALSKQRPASEAPTEVPRVLVIEDDAEVTRGLVLLLGQAGYGVDVAGTGALALAKVAQTRYAAVTLDMVLPDQNGVALIRKLRAHPDFGHCPILVLSTFMDMGKLALRDEFLGIEWLGKPIDEDQLLCALRRHVLTALPESLESAI